MMGFPLPDGAVGPFASAVVGRTGPSGLLSNPWFYTITSAASL